LILFLWKYPEGEHSTGIYAVPEFVSYKGRRRKGEKESFRVFLLWKNEGEKLQRYVDKF